MRMSVTLSRRAVVAFVAMACVVVLAQLTGLIYQAGKIKRIEADLVKAEFRRQSQFLAFFDLLDSYRREKNGSLSPEMLDRFSSYEKIQRRKLLAEEPFKTNAEALSKSD